MWRRGDYKIRVIRILFFLNNVSKVRHFDSVIELLAERGHTIVLAAARQRNRPLALPKNLALANRSLITRGRRGRIELTPCPVRRVDRWRHAAPALRQARDYLRFLDPRYAGALKLEERSAENVSARWRRLVKKHPGLARHVFRPTLALAEDAIPSERLFDLFVKYEQPDLVLVTPLVDYGSYQTDYVKSAHRLGLPVVFAPFSWDNLTNRGLIRVEPDRMLVWNDIQKKEAIELHGVSSDRVTVTGAPRFDAFFAMRASAPRDAFCREAGLDPACPYVLYLCSSEFVAPREVEFVQQWIDRLRASTDPAVRSCGVLVRPHPAHVKQWAGVNLSRFPNIVVWREKETMNADQGLFDSLHHAAAVVGLNTSAMIEAGILGKPVLSLVMPEFAGGQTDTLHFHYLRAGNGGLLEEANGFEQHIVQLRDALGGAFSHDRIRAFIERFVRPRGIAAPVTPIMADEIERAARITKRPRRAAPWHYVARGVMRSGLFLRRRV
jgi:hypothetical protein